MSDTFEKKGEKSIFDGLYRCFSDLLRTRFKINLNDMDVAVLVFSVSLAVLALGFALWAKKHSH